MKKLMIIIAFLVAIFSLELMSTYGLYESSISFIANAKTATWNIKVNGTKANVEETSFNIDSFVIEDDNGNIKKGFAPTSKMYFEINIDTKDIEDTEVSVRYDISIDLSNITNEYIKLNRVELIDNDEDIFLKTNIDTYTGVIPLNKNKHRIKFSLEWENNEDNNEIDYKTSMEGKLEIPVHVMVSQYVGEEITEYIEESQEIEENEEENIE